MESWEYWLERALQREEESYMQGAELSQKLFLEYKSTARRMRRQINDFYSRYATEQGLSYEEAVKIMNRPEMQEWQKDLGEYMAAIKDAADDQIKARLQAELDALAYNSRITRLQALEGQINAEMNQLFAKGVEQMRQEFGNQFTEGYYKKVFDLQQRAGIMAEFAHVDTDMVADIVSYPWSGAHFSDRLWQHKDRLIFSTRELLTKGAIEGTGIAQLSKDLADMMGQSYKNAERLVMTETAHFHEEANFEAYQAAGIEEYEYRARLNERTCPVCGGLDGKHFPVAERAEGTNAPPMHPRCHCVTVEYDPEEELDWINSGKPMPHRMTFEEWKQAQGVEEEPESKKDRGIKGDPKYNADARQFEAYSAILGEDAPGTIEDFRDLKYNNTAKWDMVKLDYRRRNALITGAESPLPFVDSVAAADEKFVKYLFNPGNTAGYAKGQALQSALGYSKGNWQELRQNILSSAAKYPAKAVHTAPGTNKKWCCTGQMARPPML